MRTYRIRFLEDIQAQVIRVDKGDIPYAVGLKPGNPENAKIGTEMALAFIRNDEHQTIVSMNPTDDGFTVTTTASV